MENETVWLTQAQMAELFPTTKQNISQHINNAFAEGELTPEATELPFMGMTVFLFFPEMLFSC